MKEPSRLDKILGIKSSIPKPTLGGDALTKSQYTSKRVSSRNLPTLPDGTKYEPFVPPNGDAKEYIREAGKILSNLKGVFVLGEEHTHLIKMLLDSYLRAKSLRGYTDPKMLGELRSLEQHVLDISSSLGLIEKNKPMDTPAHYVDMLQERARELIAEKGVERTVACPNCGEFYLVYAGTAHPFFQDKKLPVWSAEVRELMDRKCDCGRPKLTMEEAAYILRLPVTGWSQIIQDQERGEEEVAITESAVVMEEEEEEPTTHEEIRQ